MALGARVAGAARRGGLRVEALYGWFDRSPWAGGEDSVWVCRLGSWRATRRARSLPTRRRSATRRPRSGSRFDVALDLGRQPVPLRPEQERDPAGEVDARRVARRRAPRAPPDVCCSSLYLPTARAGRARSSRRSRAAPSARSGRRSRPTARPRRRRRPPFGSACRRCPDRRGARARASRRAPPSRQVGAAIDADHARRVRRARDLGEQLRARRPRRRAEGRPAPRSPQRPRPRPRRRRARACRASACRAACARASAARCPCEAIISAPLQPLAVEVEDARAARPPPGKRWTSSA